MSLLSCKDTVRLASEALDRHLTIGNRLALRVHLLMCRACGRFRQQLRFLSDAAHRLEAVDGQAILTPKARDRLQRALEQSIDE